MKQFIFLCMVVITVIRPISAQTLQELNAKRIGLPNGWNLTPVGNSLPLGDLPLNLAVAHSKKYMAVTNNGQSTQTLQLIDIKNKKVLHSVEIAKAWLGLCFSKNDDYLYVSGGNDNRIIRYAVKNDKLVYSDSIVIGKSWPERISIAGMDIDHRTNILYVVTKENNSLYLIDLSSKQILKKVSLPAEAYTIVVSPLKKEAYISCWGSASIVVFNIASQSITHQIKVGSNPNDITLSPNGNNLYVANANDNSVSIIDLKKYAVIETLNTALYPDALGGSTTNSVALSSDAKTLFIANADNNCLSVYDVFTFARCPLHRNLIGHVSIRGWFVCLFSR